MVTVKQIKIGLLSLASVFTLAACGSQPSQSSTPAEKEKVVFNLPAGAEIPKMDSTKVTDVEGFQALASVAEGLYRNAKEGTGYDLALAAEEPKVSEDGLTLTFKLRDTKWSNGDPLKADDFVFAWKRLVDPEIAAEYSYLMSGVVKNASEILKGEKKPDELGVKAIDEKTLEVQLETNVPYFKSLLAMAPFYPLNQKYVEEQGDKYASDSDHLLFIGPFIMKDWDGTGLSWKFEKNEGYWDKDAVEADEINVQVVKEVSTGLNLYDSGELDRLVLSGDYVVQRKSDSGFVTEPTSALFFIRFNVDKDKGVPALKNQNIRRALSMAVDKQVYVDKVLQNGSLPTAGVVPTGLAANPSTKVDFREEQKDGVNFDAAKAKELWQKGIDELGVKEVELRFLSDDSDNAKKTSEFIQAQLQDNLPGLKVSLENVPFKNRLAKSDEGDFDMVLSGWGADYADPINYLELFETSNGNNVSKYSNPEFDKLLAAARLETKDVDKRWKDLLEAERILLADGAIAPLYQRYRAALLKDTVGHWVTHSVGPYYDYKYITKKK